MPKIVYTYGITAMGLFIMSFFVSGGLDIASHDSYLVMSNAQVVSMLGMVFAVFGVITWAITKIGRRLSTFLSWMHYGITVACLLIMTIALRPSTQPKNYEDYSEMGNLEEIQSSNIVNEWLAIVLLTLILSQLLFVINMIRSFIVKK